VLFDISIEFIKSNHGNYKVVLINDKIYIELQFFMYILHNRDCNMYFGLKFTRLNFNITYLKFKFIILFKKILLKYWGYKNLGYLEFSVGVMKLSTI
jgi:hypothetical protein